ncbi:anti-sigma factor [Kineosporia sp. R_H_3]|uniref:anti-sigma factor family protein n=1 Tax=Kineosporia sp. R_H_3 TaxID=1961848 RepID=UPI000B4BFD5D|nr:zf-HC2 domain-containing protein [Kineosporia sp. R_H_3]
MTQDVPEDDDLTCTQVVMLITDYLDDALPTTERALLDEHLADCDGCSAVLEQFRTTVAVTGTLAQDDVDRLDDTTREELLGVFRRWSADRPPA